MDIYVFQEDGPTVKVRVPSDADLHDLKAAIQEKLDICPDQQYLYKNQVIITTLSNLSQQRVHDESSVRLKVFLKDTIKIFVHWLGGDTITLFVKRSDTVADLTARLQKKIGSEADGLKLYSHGIWLQKQSTLVADIPLVNFSSLRAEGGFSSKLEIAVRSEHFETFLVNIMASDTIQALKFKIYQEISLRPTFQRLYYQGKLLADCDYLEKNKMENGASVFLKIVAPVLR